MQRLPQQFPFSTRGRVRLPPNPDTLFLIPFVLIGVALIFAVGYFFLALFNPRARLRITPGTPRLGSTLQVEWRFTGRSDVLQQVSLWLEGREEATYRRGTSTSTDRKLRLFWFTRGKGTEDAAVVDTLRFETPQAEEARPFRFVLPEAPYSVSGKLISLVWALELVAEPSREVDRLELVVAPGGREVLLESQQQDPPRQPWIAYHRP